MKILLFTLELPPATNGIATFDGEFAAGLLEAGHELVLLTTQETAACAPHTGKAPAWVRLSGRHAAALDEVRHFLPFDDAVAAHYAAAGLVYAEWLRAHADTLRADLALVPDFGGIGAFLHPLPCPLVVVCHCLHQQLAAHDPRPTPGAGFLSALEFDALTRADALIALGERNARDIRRRTGREVGVAPLPLPPSAFAVARDASIAAPPRGIVAGRLDPYRGAETVARALQTLHDEGLPVVVDWYGADVPAPGGGRMSDRLAAEFPSVWGRSLRWHPPLPRDELARRRAAADFAVVASRWETFSYAAVEAMAAGLPCVISSGAGVADWARPGVDALTFPADDAPALADALRRLARDPAARRAMGEAARDRARETFARPAATAALLAEAGSLLARRRGAPAAAPSLAAHELPGWVRKHLALRGERAEIAPTRRLLRILLDRALGRAARRHPRTDRT